MILRGIKIVRATLIVREAGRVLRHSALMGAGVDCRRASGRILLFRRTREPSWLPVRGGDCQIDAIHQRLCCGSG